MKKYIDFSIGFAVYGLCCGVYYREFTKFNGFTERTMLGMAHPHVLMLGALGFLIMALFVKILNIEETKKSKIARILYTAGLITASVMMLVRGTMEVMGSPISSGISGAIAGIAGLGHIAVAVGMIMALSIIKKNA